jgi:hypothetical protein
MVFGKIRLSTILILLLIIGLYFLTRLTDIMSLPIFTDEAIYVRWSQIARQDSAWRFISLTDGKQPSFVWIAMTIMRVIDDPLLASRLVSVFSGLGTLVGIMLLSLEIFKKKRTGGVINQIFGHFLENKSIGYLTGILFVLFPFALVLDRMALYDSLVACTMVWVLYMEVLLVRYIRLDLALITGAVIGAAVLTKTSGFFAIYLLPFSALLFNFKEKYRIKKLFEWIFFAFISVFVAYLMYAILRLSPFFYIIDEKNGLFIYTFSEWINHPLEYVSGNFNALFSWLSIYVSVPVLALALCSFLIKGSFREKLFLLIWFGAPFFGLVVFGKTLYPRFIYFMTIPLIILAAYTIFRVLNKISSKVITAVVFIILIFLYVRADYYIIFDFPNAPIPKADLGQYINSWPAGGGVKEMIGFFDKESKNGKIFVLTQGTFGSLPTNSMEIYLEDNKNIEKKGVYPLPDILPFEYQTKAKSMPVYIVFNDSENPPPNWPITLIAKYQKGIGDRHLSIYRVNP